MALQGQIPPGPVGDLEIEPATVPEQADQSSRRGTMGVPPRVSRVVLAACALLVLVAVFGPLLTPETKVTLLDRLKPPVGFGGTWDHPLGTDSLGRDILVQ